MKQYLSVPLFALVFNFPAYVWAEEILNETIIYSTEEECVQATGQDCDYVMCDYIPEGKTVEEVCGEGPSKGWQPKQETIGPESDNSNVEKE